MARSKAFVIAAGVALASGGLAGAADLPPAPRLPPPAPVVEDFSGWYLRGDVGLGVAAARPNLQNEPDPISTGVSSDFLSPYASKSFNNTTLSPSGMFDFGVGYRFNNWVRMDGTLEYRGGARLQSLYTLTDPASPFFGGPLQYADFFNADVSSLVGLVNGYVDLGNYWGVTPFVGAGVGFADNMLSGFTDQGFGYASFGSLGSCRQLFGQRLENKLRLGADGRARFRRHAQSEAGARLPLSQLRFDQERRIVLSRRRRRRRLHYRELHRRRP